MSALSTLVDGVKHLDDLLEEEVLEPDIRREDWISMRGRVRMLQDTLANEVEAPLEEALVEVTTSEPDLEPLIRLRVAGLFARAAAVIHASGDPSTAMKELAAGLRVSTDEEQRKELTAAERAPEIYWRLIHGRWLLRHERHREADKVFKEIIRSSPEKGIKDAAKRALDGPRPITRAPTLFRINGFGLSLYGKRDEGPDGSYVATHCVCFAFIPVFPLAAYRVRRVDYNSYQFGWREPLSRFARAFRAIVLGGALSAGLIGGVSSYLDSPGYKSRAAYEEAAAFEASGDRDKALEQYRSIVSTYALREEVNLEPAAEATVRLTVSSVKEPCSPAEVETIRRVVAAYDDLPAAPRAGKARDHLLERLSTWADQLGDATAERADAEIMVLDMAERVAEGSEAVKEIHAKQAKLSRTLAERAKGDRPLAALAHYTRIPSEPGVLEAMAEIIEGFGEGPSMWVEAEALIQAWEAASKLRGKLEPERARIEEKLETAKLAYAKSQVIIESGDEKRINAALAASPQDQELVSAAAGLLRARGDAKAAIAKLEALGPPGRTTANAQQILAGCHMDAGDLPKADAIVSALLAERLPPFQVAQRAYSKALEDKQKQIMTNLQAAGAPASVEKAYQSASDAEKPGIIREYISGELSRDKELSALQEEYLRHGAVVPASLQLGTIKLRRANESSGEARRALLADAEKAFLSIRDEAEGTPMFHLGLGQVFYRLGKVEEGNRELESVLARKDPMLTLAVARIYRELGLSRRAQQICEALYDASDASDASDALANSKVKHEAALFAAHLVDESSMDEERTLFWLSRCDKTVPGVQVYEESVKARQLARQGKFALADQAYARVVQGYAREGKHSGVAANNAALAHFARYGVTGDKAHMKRAIEQLELAVHLESDNAIAIGNLAEGLSFTGIVTVLDRWVHTSALLLARENVYSLTETMLLGPKRAEALELLRGEPSLRRSLELKMQEQALAPQRNSAYHTHLWWYDQSRDDKGLEELLKRVEGVSSFDVEAASEERRAFAAGEKDESLGRIASQSVDRSWLVVEQAEKDGHRPTMAAAWLLYAESLDHRAYFDTSMETRETEIKAYRKAWELWPEMGLSNELAGVLARAAAEKAAKEVPALAEWLKKEIRVLDASLLLHRAIHGENGSAVLSALRKQPELGEAVKLRRADAGSVPTLLDYVLSEIVEDAEYKAAAARVFERRDLGLSLTIEDKLFPGQERESALLALFKSKGAYRP